MSMDNPRSLTGERQQIIVVVPVYNCKAFLKEAVYSVLEQPYRAIEIILVDDGSTDGSSELCDQLAAKEGRIHVIHQKNAGVSAARNAGIEYVLGRNQDGYLAFLDADDAWDADFFTAEIVELLGKGYSLIGFQSCNCDKNLRPYDRPGSMEAGVHVGGQNKVWLHSGQHFGAMLYACALIREENVRFFEGLHYSEDKIFSMQCMYLAETIWLENRLLYNYRHAGSSAMSRRARGIPYFTPILNGYLKLDEMLQHSGKAPLKEARNIVGVFTMEMTRSIINFSGPSERLIDFLQITHVTFPSLQHRANTPT